MSKPASIAIQQLPPESLDDIQLKYQDENIAEEKQYQFVMAAISHANQKYQDININLVKFDVDNKGELNNYIENISDKHGLHRVIIKNGGHYTVIEIDHRNLNDKKALILDASKDRRQFQLYCHIRETSYEVVVSNSGFGSDNNCSLQKDNYSSSLFSLDHCINIYTARKDQTISNELDQLHAQGMSQYGFVDWNDWPPEFVRNAQTISQMNAYIAKLESDPQRSYMLDRKHYDGMTLREYVSAGTRKYLREIPNLTPITEYNNFQLVTANESINIHIFQKIKQQALSAELREALGTERKISSSHPLYLRYNLAIDKLIQKIKQKEPKAAIYYIKSLSIFTDHSNKTELDEIRKEVIKGCDESIKTNKNNDIKKVIAYSIAVLSELKSRHKIDFNKFKSISPSNNDEHTKNEEIQKSTEDYAEEFLAKVEWNKNPYGVDEALKILLAAPESLRLEIITFHLISNDDLIQQIIDNMLIEGNIPSAAKIINTLSNEDKLKLLSQYNIAKNNTIKRKEYTALHQEILKSFPKSKLLKTLTHKVESMQFGKLPLIETLLVPKGMAMKVSSEDINQSTKKIIEYLPENERLSALKLCENGNLNKTIAELALFNPQIILFIYSKVPHNDKAEIAKVIKSLDIDLINNLDESFREEILNTNIYEEQKKVNIEKHSLKKQAETKYSDGKVTVGDADKKNDDDSLKSSVQLKDLNIKTHQEFIKKKSEKTDISKKENKKQKLHKASDKNHILERQHKENTYTYFLNELNRLSDQNHKLKLINDSKIFHPNSTPPNSGIECVKAQIKRLIKISRKNKYIHIRQIAINISKALINELAKGTIEIDVQNIKERHPQLYNALNEKYFPYTNADIESTLIKKVQRNFFYRVHHGMCDLATTTQYFANNTNNIPFDIIEKIIASDDLSCDANKLSLKTIAKLLVSNNSAEIEKKMLCHSLNKQIADRLLFGLVNSHKSIDHQQKLKLLDFFEPQQLASFFKSHKGSRSMEPLLVDYLDNHQATPATYIPLSSSSDGHIKLLFEEVDLIDLENHQVDETLDHYHSTNNTSIETGNCLTKLNALKTNLETKVIDNKPEELNSALNRVNRAIEKYNTVVTNNPYLTAALMDKVIERIDMIETEVKNVINKYYPNATIVDAQAEN